MQHVVLEQTHSGRQVTILSGASGSGKTYLADRILMQTQGVRVCTNNFFMEGGVYKFDRTQLQAAHADCFRHFMTFLMRGVAHTSPMVKVERPDHIVVDNTNTTTWEIAPYILAASAYGWNYRVVTIVLTQAQIAEAHKRNVHDCPLHAVAGQSQNIAKRKMPAWWKASYIPAQFVIDAAAATPWR